MENEVLSFLVACICKYYGFTSIIAV